MQAETTHFLVFLDVEQSDTEFFIKLKMRESEKK